MSSGSTSIYAASGAVRGRPAALAMFGFWLAIVTPLAWTHLVFRDEVRALSKALQGATLFGMIQGLHGEAHPSIWYLLLRGVHALVARPEILMFVSVAIAAAAMLILVLRSPFNLPFLAVLLMASFSTYEYSVMARNYGISMLALFLYALCYERHREKDFLPGCVLFLLANCNALSALLAGGLLLLWLTDIREDAAANRPRNVRLFLLNGALAAVGIAICVWTIFPTYSDYSDSVLIAHRAIKFRTVAESLFLPSRQFAESCLPQANALTGGKPFLDRSLEILRSLILFGSTLGLLRRPGAFLAGLTTLVGLSIFFVFVYSGGYRHQALWLVFMVCLYWLAARKDTSGLRLYPAWLQHKADPLAKAGTALFVLLMLLQLPNGTLKIAKFLINPATALKNRANSVSALLAEHPDLKEAVVIADPDYLLETLPYYISNPTYLMREQRYGNVVHFTKHARLELSLDDVLSNAREIRRTTGRSVLILLSHTVDPSLSAIVYAEGYNWKLIVTPQQAIAFQLSTRFLKHSRAPPENDDGYDEEYDIYVLE